MKKIYFQFFLLLALTPHLLLAQQEIFSFNRLKINEGLYGIEIRSIFRDSKGFMWFATDRGMVKFDSYKFQIFRHNLDDTASLSNDNVFDITEDASGSLWISTYSGLNKFNRKKSKFSAFYIDEKIKTSTNTNFILKARVDPQSKVWSLVANKGLYAFDSQEEDFIELKYSEILPENFDQADITCFIISKNGSVWFGTTEETESLGLYNYDPVNKKLKSFLPGGPDDLSSNVFYNILEDKKGNIWIGHYTGLQKLDPKTGIFTSYYFNSIPSGRIDALEEDDEGMIWAGTNGNGLARLDPLTGEFKIFKNEPKIKSSISSNKILSLYNDNNGLLWIGTDKGLNQLNLRPKNFGNYLYVPEEDEISSTNQIKDLYTDQEDLIWYCTEKGLFRFDGKTSPELVLPVPCKELVQDSSGQFWLIGNELVNFDPKTGEVLQHSADPSDPDKLNSNQLWSLYIDSEEFIWIGTGEGGLNGLDLKSGKMVHFLHDPQDENSISTNEVGPILRDNDELWLGPFKGGLNCINLKTGQIERYLPDPKNPYSLSHDVVTAIHKDKTGRVWVGTYQGLNVLDQQRKQFIRIKETEGLANDIISVNGITEDRNGNIWVATSAGMSKIHPHTLTVRNYDSRDGFQQNPNGNLVKNRDGKIFYFGSNGFTSFVPEEIEERSLPPAVSITGFMLFNKPVIPGTHPALPNEISETEEINISYKESFMTFEFAAHNYFLTEKNQYAYKMEGFDGDWIYSGSQRYATYTNLPPGKSYTFKVIASNNDGIWNTTGASLKIYIIPPFWATTWFRLLLASAFLVSLILFYRWRNRQHYRQRKLLEKMVKERTEEVEAQKEALEIQANHLKLANREIRIKNRKILKQATKLKIIDKLKSQFLANISHELRTPLTLILSPIEEIISEGKLNGDIKGQLNMMDRNARRLLQLINQLLDLSKIENKNMPLELSGGDLVYQVKSIVSSFNYQAKKNKIDFQFHSTESEINCCFDADKLEKIIFNLLSNAFKFTPEGGKIKVKLELVGKSDQERRFKENQVKITINDSGIGISPQHLPYIFDRFYQVTSDTARNTDGTGIGLALTKEMVLLQGGDITVESEIGKGTLFSFFLPLNKSHQVQIPKAEPNILPLISENLNEEVFIALKPFRNIKENQPLLLIIEDNQDLRQFIKRIFSPYYKIKEAADGIEGREKAFNLLPDLIISDVMMPGQDGLTLCHQLKNNVQTSHIPTILLSARIDAELAGLQSGADDYITKPFNAKSLILKVKNLLITRSKYRELISREIGLKSISSTIETFSINNQDQQFLDKASQIALDNLENVKFETDIFYRELGMSRTLVYKKLKSLSGLSPNEFMRKIRLNKAAQLLKNEQLRVSEVMERVGFNHRSYFINCFKKQFGKLPSDLLSKDNNSDYHLSKRI